MAADRYLGAEGHVFTGSGGGKDGENIVRVNENAKSSTAGVSLLNHSGSIRGTITITFTGMEPRCKNKVKVGIGQAGGPLVSGETEVDPSQATGNPPSVTVELNYTPTEHLTSNKPFQVYAYSLNPNTRINLSMNITVWIFHDNIHPVPWPGEEPQTPEHDDSDGLVWPRDQQYSVLPGGGGAGNYRFAAGKNGVEGRQYPFNRIDYYYTNVDYIPLPASSLQTLIANPPNASLTLSIPNSTGLLPNEEEYSRFEKATWINAYPSTQLIYITTSPLTQSGYVHEFYQTNLTYFPSGNVYSLFSSNEGLSLTLNATSPPGYVYPNLNAGDSYLSISAVAVQPDSQLKGPYLITFLDISNAPVFNPAYAPGTTHFSDGKSFDGYWNNTGQKIALNLVVKNDGFGKGVNLPSQLFTAESIYWKVDIMNFDEITKGLSSSVTFTGPDERIVNPGDADRDNIPDLSDNCPNNYNPGQVDSDSDTFGNWCDTCPGVSNPTQTDSDGNGIGDACEPPDYFFFNNAESTNFSGITDFSNVPNLKLTHGDASIQWANPVNILNKDLNTYIDIQPDYVIVDKNHLDASMDSEAKITFEGVNCNDFIIYHKSGTPEDYEDIKSGSVMATQANTGLNCVSPLICQNIDCSAGTLSFDAMAFSGYATGPSTNLTIWDDTDTLTKYVNQVVKFYANYSNATSGAPITGANCNITFQLVPSGPFVMTYNAGSALYEYNRTFSSPGPSNWDVNCSAAGFANLKAADTVSISTTPGIPEFSTYAMLLALVIVIAGFFFVQRRKV